METVNQILGYFSVSTTLLLSFGGAVIAALLIALAVFGILQHKFSRKTGLIIAAVALVILVISGTVFSREKTSLESRAGTVSSQQK